jgi:hypothetical protein
VNKLFALVLFSIFTIRPAITEGVDYILYVRPSNELGKELRTYWNDVKSDSSISHSAITTYPPHCSLTGFFPRTEPKATYIRAVKDAMDSLDSASKTISVKALVQGNQNQPLDYIQLSSSYLLTVTKAFMKNASIPSKYLKDPQAFPYHITLRNHVYVQNAQKKLKKIQKLERKIHLKAKASWSLYLYQRDDNGDLSVVKEFPI